MKKRVFEIICKAEDGDKASRAFDVFIMLMVALNVLSIILESFEGLALKYRDLFTTFETFSVAVFTVEYLLRIWTADLLYPDSRHPYLKYVLSPMAIVDLLSVLPFYLPAVTLDTRALRMLKLFRMTRLLRIFKLRRYFDALRGIGAVMRDSASQLVMSIVICFFVILFSSIIMYAVENPVQPEQFPNIIASLWWAICTLTTVGYGDVYPITTLGKLFASVISFVGIGIIAIPTGIVAAGFSSAINGQKKETDEKQYCPYCGHKLDE